MSDSFFITLNSNDGVFNANLPKTIHLDGKWNVELAFLDLNHLSASKHLKRTHRLMVFCDLCQDSYIMGEGYRPLLEPIPTAFRLLWKSDVFSVPLKEGRPLDHFKVWVESYKGGIEKAFQLGPSTCTLRFTRAPQDAEISTRPKGGRKNKSSHSLCWS